MTQWGEFRAPLLSKRLSTRLRTLASLVVTLSCRTRMLCGGAEDGVWL